MGGANLDLVAIGDGWSGGVQHTVWVQHRCHQQPKRCEDRAVIGSDRWGVV